MPADTAKEIDIVIAALNEEQSIGACIDALHGDAAGRYQLNVFVVLDPRTTDRTASIATARGAHIIRPERHGLGSARLLGVNAGNAELIGMLDAHSIIQRGWLDAMVSAFVDPMVGGTQGSIDYECRNPTVRGLVSTSIFGSEEKVLDHTVWGRFSPYPWILGGNSMFRREAFEDVEIFTDLACDDAERSWQIFLSGFQLVYVPGARILHVDNIGVVPYLRKTFAYGRNACNLARAYGFACNPTNQPSGNRKPAAVLLNLLYTAGYRFEQMRLRFGFSTVQQHITSRASRFSTAFRWSEGVRYQLSPSARFWRIENQYVLVDLVQPKRIVFDGVAETIFSCLVRQFSRKETAERVAQEHSAPVEAVLEDLDEFIETLLSENILQPSDAAYGAKPFSVTNRAQAVR